MRQAWLFARSLAYAALFLGVAAFWLPLRVFERRPRWPAAWLWPQYAGALALVLGAAVMAACLWFFVTRGRGTPAPFDPPEKFVRRGPYKWVRNPIYLGLLAVVGGEGLFLWSGHILVYFVCITCFLHVFVVVYEEDALRRQFGAMYEDYRREVPRWLPRRPKPMLQTVAPFEARR
jgi:protein-S-isoprenylcysteine O-methyltransferase Ste14